MKTNTNTEKVEVTPWMIELMVSPLMKLVCEQTIGAIVTHHQHHRVEESGMYVTRYFSADGAFATVVLSDEHLSVAIVVTQRELDVIGRLAETH